MKKLIFISLLVATAHCKAADPNESWQQAVQHIPNWMEERALNLDNNHINAIPDNLNLPQLQWLYLHNNQIRDIPAGLNLPQLKSLTLNNNQIRDIPNNLNLPRLRILHLHNNQIQAIPNNLPQQLEMLYLNNNQIREIHAGLNLPQLGALVLNNNQIREIPADLNLPQLESLILNSNYIEHIDPGIFKRFPHLRFINLNKNPLTPENVDLLRAAANDTGRNIEIMADEIGEAYLRPGINIKGTRRR